MSFPIENEIKPKEGYVSDITPYISSIIVRGYHVHYLQTDDMIGARLRAGEYWEEWMLPLLQRYYRPKTNMVDIGSFIGTTAMMMSELFTNQENEHLIVYAFEPIFHDYIYKNVESNGLTDKIKVFPCGLSNENCYLKANSPDLRNFSNFGATSLRPYDAEYDTTLHNENHIVVTIKRLDAFDLNNISIMKIDVENMEIGVLEGAIETIERCRPVILLESYMIDIVRNSTVFRRMVSSCGYQITPALPHLPAHEICDYILIPRDASLDSALKT